MRRAIAVSLSFAALAAVSAAAPSGQVRGTVSYGRNTPAVGAIVMVRPEGAASPVRLATTGTGGTFAFDGLVDGTYEVEVRRDGSVPIVKSGIKVRAPFRAVVEVLLLPGEAPRAQPATVDGSVSIVGSVRIASGAPLAEARVRLMRNDGLDDSKTVQTDSAGAFSLPPLKAGRWRIEVHGAGFLPLRANLDLSGDVVLVVQLAAQPANYRPLPQDLIVPEDVIPPAGAASIYFDAAAPPPPPPRTAK